MRILLPPSETKRDGGDADAVVRLDALSFPGLQPQRVVAIRALRRLASNLSTMSDALRLGPGQRFELLRNRALRSAPTMPAIERYTGVLYDGIDVQTLSPDARRSAAEMVVIHSALFGLIGADDLIPAYRVSHDSRLPDVRLASLWRDAVTAELESMHGLVLDLRSEAYAKLGPLPLGPEHHVLRVVARRGDGTVRALNHFNKRGKGEFVRAVVLSGRDFADARSLIDWAVERGIRLSVPAPGEMQLVVDQTAGARGEK